MSDDVDSGAAGAELPDLDAGQDHAVAAIIQLLDGMPISCAFAVLKRTRKMLLWAHMVNVADPRVAAVLREVEGGAPR